MNLHTKDVKQETCSFHMRGFCKYGKDCFFAHPKEQQSWRRKDDRDDISGRNVHDYRPENRHFADLEPKRFKENPYQNNDRRDYRTQKYTYSDDRDLSKYNRWGPERTERKDTPEQKEVPERKDVPMPGRKGMDDSDTRRHKFF